MADTEYRYAGFWWRVLAYFIDYVVIVVAFFIIGGVLGLGFGLSSADATAIGTLTLFLVLVAFVAVWLYHALGESSRWKGTFGKRACGLVVVDEAGNQISFGRATGRYFAKVISSVILCVGYMMAGWTRRKQGLHDMIAGTLVLRRIHETEHIVVPSDMRPTIRMPS
jgi:uncharacterized RDD family membrane protein YckC